MAAIGFGRARADRRGRRRRRTRGGCGSPRPARLKSRPWARCSSSSMTAINGDAELALSWKMTLYPTDCLQEASQLGTYIISSFSYSSAAVRKRSACRRRSAGLRLEDACCRARLCFAVAGMIAVSCRQQSAPVAIAGDLRDYDEMHVWTMALPSGSCRTTTSHSLFGRVLTSGSSP